MNKKLSHSNFLRVAAYQGEPIERNPSKALEKMLEITHQAHRDRVDILCFPEVFLHGHFENEDEARDFSLDLENATFKEICETFREYTPTVIFGLNESKGNHLYNTAVLVEKGELKGIYRKQHTYPPYTYYALGDEASTFEFKDIKIGILICYDSTFMNPARKLVQKGVRIIFMPCFNRISNNTKMPRYLEQKNHLVARSGENDCWIVVSDIVCESEDSHCPGYACIYSSDGDLVTQSLPYQEIVVTYDIPLQTLQNVHNKRLLG